MKPMKNKIYAVLILLSTASACKNMNLNTRNENKNLPNVFVSQKDSINSAKLNWKNYFNDVYLNELIDSALVRNQELNIVQQEIEISRNEVKARKGEYLPFVKMFAGSGIEKAAEFTRDGAVEHNLNIKENEKFPEPLGDIKFGASASWEVDIWKKLRNAKQSAVHRYLASVEGKRFVQTNLVAEVSNLYYELIALDNLKDIVKNNIDIQSNALKIIKQQKESAKATQLAVNRFEAQLLNTQNLIFSIDQRIVQTENKLNFLLGRYPQEIKRDKTVLNSVKIDEVHVGAPSDLIENRPDVKAAEQELMAAKLDVKVARANFYPSLGLNAGIGFQAFKPDVLLSPESKLFNLSGDLMAPLINRNAIKAMYRTANNKQMQAVYKYEQTLLNAYLEVVNQMNMIANSSNSYNTKAKEVDILNASIGISNSLFNSARADYIEVLLTQREAIDSKMELIEIKLQQLNAKVNIYKALGGGWN